jgi:hypothetical protein
MYFPDLSPYAYLQRERRSGLMNVGWLGAAEPFSRAPPTPELLARIWAYSQFATAPTRGFHECELCSVQPLGIPQIEHNGQHLKLGSAEIRVFGKNGRVYAAPNLLYHYVRDHLYAPPEEFVQALLQSPGPESEEYFEMMDKIRISWRKQDRLCSTGSTTGPGHAKL